ncbi:glycogen debranching protein [Geoanaerobacter pelophilus]|uniref:Glycogen debranching protein n=1 Tax=Geoanaerobacter pelophilus TaxID=60036 RepID=A0ABQ0MFM8_9BACT|nr:amylo-alpha-1,6-glucosidase [Geoanaerobacter pelophilus]GAW65891.1 glycogen debranching protein [Geoanaerobacter pelophilus]
MTTVTRDFHFDRHDEKAKTRQLLEQEWLLTNGLGGYASGTVCGALTRRYHGLLIAAFPSPLGRMVMLNRLTEAIRFPDGSTVRFGGDQREGGRLDFEGIDYLTGFRLEDGLPVWRYKIQGSVIEKQLVMVHKQNTVHLIYRLVSGEQKVRLKLQPYLQFRPHDASVDQVVDDPYMFTAVQNRYQISTGSHSPQLRLVINGGRGNFTLEEKQSTDIFYDVENARGYDALGTLWTAGYFAVDLAAEQDAALTASTESWETLAALPPEAALAMERERRRLLLAAADPKARQGLAAELVLATDQFIITPAGRHKDSVRAHAMGDEVCTVIAGYHWFTDWGRDTMISLEGLTLATGRHMEAGWILRTFAHYVRNGLIPNLFPEGHNDGLYHTADASLWFFHAVNRYLSHTGDDATLQMIMPQLQQIIDKHLSGTSFGIGVDPSDGLLRQGAEGYQLTWMDAKVGDWVVTPRRGKAVELNALWYNALRLMQQWTEQDDPAYSRQLGSFAEQTCRSFNSRFWYPEGGYLYDLVDGEQGDDDACRPNQLFAISLDHPVLDREKWSPVLETVRKRLLTPVGLRTLAPGHPDYKPTYHGDLRARDAAYHQGTVWPWLIGTFIDSWLKLYPDQVPTAHSFLDGLARQMNHQCIGSISEIFDAEKPYLPKGCIAQAWSVAEMLRCWLKTAP